MLNSAARCWIWLIVRAGSEKCVSLNHTAGLKVIYVTRQRNYPGYLVTTLLSYLFILLTYQEPRYREQEFNLHALSGFVPVRTERSVNITMLELVHGQSWDGLPANRWRLRYHLAA